MARRMWLSKRLSPKTCRAGTRAFLVAVADGADFQLACRFAGYYLDEIRQTGERVFVVEEGGTQRTIDHLERMLRGVRRSGWRFARGRNGPLYEEAGRRAILGGIAEAVGLKPDTPVGVVGDYLRLGLMPLNPNVPGRTPPWG